MSAADYMALSGNSAFGKGDWAWIIVLLLIFGGGAGFGFGGQALTRAELNQGFNDNTVIRKLDGITNGLSDGFYAVNTGMLNGFNGLGQQIATCCCETNRNIDAVRYEAAKNTCDIVRAIEKDGDATRALINANTMQALRDKIVAKDQELQTANFQLSQQAQSASLISALRPFPQPAYITCSPYQAVNYGYGCNPCCQYA